MLQASKVLLLAPLLVDHDGGRLPGLRRQLDPDHRRVEQKARETSAVARHLPDGNRGAGTELP